jgi:hypothetical protein
MSDRAWYRLLVGLIIILAAQPLYRGNAKADQPGAYGPLAVYALQYKVDNDEAFKIVTIGNSINDEPLETLSAVPPCSSRQPKYSWISLGSFHEMHSCLADESVGTGTGYDTLIVDVNNNDDLTDDRKIRGTRNQAGTVTEFRPFQLMVDVAGQKYPCHIRTRMDTKGAFPRFTFCGYCEGRIILGDKAYNVALFDDNYNGLFSDRYAFSPATPTMGATLERGDTLVIDINRDGRLGKDGYETPETYHLGKYVSVGQKCYEIDVLDNGRELALREKTAHCGTIDVKTRLPQYSVELINNDGPVRLNGSTEGLFKVPAGEYLLYAWNFHGTDSEGTEWHVVCRQAQNGPRVVVRSENRTALNLDSTLNEDVWFELETHGNRGEKWRVGGEGKWSPRMVEIKPDGGASLPFGGPLTATVQSRREGNSVEFTLNIRGKNGEVYSPDSLTLNGSRLPAPGFEVRDGQGRVVHSGKFEFG